MKRELAALLPQLTNEQLERFDLYYRRLIEWNERVNLTAITEKADVAKKHFYDSLLALPYVPPAARCVDVGTGAGFPGVPILIARPDVTMALLDSLQKRLAFLEALLFELGLSARLLHARAEDAGRDGALRESFDIALSRAVAPLPVLAELTVPLLRVGGVSIAYKGDAADEMTAAKNAARLLNVRLASVDVTGDYGARSLVLMQKTAKTPAAYPRKAGTPAKNPL